MLKHLVIDNIFSDPDSVVEWSKKCYFYSSDENHPKKPSQYWVGYRTEALHTLDQQFYNNTMNEIVCNIFNTELMTTNIDFSYSINTYFHRLLSNHTKTENWIHKDPSLFSAVIYLSKNPAKNSGTMLYDEEKNLSSVVENRYNRLLMYNGGHLHSAEGGFGDNVDNSRLTLVFFVYNFMITQK